MVIFMSKEDFKDFKRGFNNRYICFEYPFAWKDIETEEESEFTDAVLFDKGNNAIVKVSTKPCLVDDINDLKKEVEKDLQSKGCIIQQSAIDKLNNHEIWDVFYTVSDDENLEIEQFSILKDNNLYTLELYTKNNRDPVVVNEFVKVITTFKILKPSYKVENDSYEKI